MGGCGGEQARMELMQMEIMSGGENGRMTGAVEELMRIARRIVCGTAILVCLCVGAEAQEQRPLGQAGSELGRENMSRVAASAGQIKAVLVKDSGLLVELKR